MSKSRFDKYFLEVGRSPYGAEYVLGVVAIHQ